MPEGTPLLPTKPRSNRAVYVAFVFPALAGLMYGYDIGAASPSVVSFGTRYPTTTDIMSNSNADNITVSALGAVQTSMLTSASLFGAVPTSLSIFWIGEPMGRRREVILASMLYCLGSLMSILAFGSSSSALGIAVIGRIIYGAGIAFAMHAAPAYIAEMAPPDLRGTLISLKEAFIVFGMVLAYSVAALAEGILPDDGAEAFRIIWAVPILVSFVAGWGMYQLPPSPRWLVSRGRKEEAMTALRTFRTDAELPCLRWFASSTKPHALNTAEIEAEVNDMVVSLMAAKRTAVRAERAHTRSHAPSFLPRSLSYAPPYVLAHLLTCSLAHLLTCSLAHLLTCSLAHLPRQSLSAGLNEEAIQRSLSRPVTDSNICDVCDDIKQLLTVPRALILGGLGSPSLSWSVSESVCQSVSQC